MLEKYFKIKNLKKVTNTKKKIVFISQMSNLWINVDDLYNQLSNDDQFETYVLMIPEFDYSKKEFDIQTMNTKIYDFHKNHNHQNTIKAFDQGKWFDLKNINPDYVFYERPYSSYLPMEYKISTVSKYTKTCYLPYGYEMMNYIFDTSLNVDFFRYLHIFFADSYVTESFNKKRAPLSHRLGLRKTILTGHPIFNAFNKAQSEDNLFWDNDDQHFKIIWAPRWTIDTQLGGSNFLTYKDNIVDYVEKDKKFYMFYSTEEHICVATADSPLGPFKQDEHKPIREEKSIDTSVFFDEDGKAYLYFVRFNDGNVIWCAELKENLKEIKEETLTQCFKAEEPWELVLPKVVEGPSVFKQNGVYYLIYSANGYTSQDYAVGFATSDSPFGPWKKYEGNPVLHKCDGLVGVGHGAPFVDMEGKMRYVFHAHKSESEIHPRNSFVVDMFVKDSIVSLGGNIVRPMVVDRLPSGK